MVVVVIDVSATVLLWKKVRLPNGLPWPMFEVSNTLLSLGVWPCCIGVLSMAVEASDKKERGRSVDELVDVE